MLSNTCVGTAVAPGASCVVSVGFKPTRTNARSVARLILTSTPTTRPSRSLLVGRAPATPSAAWAATSPASLSLTLGAAPSFGAFVPAVGPHLRRHGGSATVVSTAGNATLSVTDATNTAPGHLVNGTFSLPQALQVRATNAANPNTTYQSLSETSGTPVNLLSYPARPRARTR